MKHFFILLWTLFLLTSTVSPAFAEAYTDPLTYSYAYENVEQDLQTLAVRYPDLVRVEAIGTTIQHRTLYALSLGKGAEEGLILVGVHATELPNTPMVMRAVWDLVQGKADASFLEQVTLVIVPVVNPDGYERARKARDKGVNVIRKGNANYININRNFPVCYWEVLNQPGDHNWAGWKPGTEPETQAIMSLIASHRFAAGMDIHSQGRTVYYGKPAFRQEDVHTDRSVNLLDKRNAEIARAILPDGYRLIWDDDAIRTGYGTTTDYMFQEGIPCVCLETMPDGDYRYAAVREEYEFLDLPRVLERFSEMVVRYGTEFLVIDE